MRLSEEHIQLIQERVDRSNLTFVTLRDDLVDHICCSVESRLEDGHPFEKSLEEAIKELAPKGFEVLEMEAIMLLESKNTPMKILMYLVGLLSSVCWTIGFTFRILRWPGGVELSDFGLFGFVFIFLPMMAYNSFRQKIKRTTAEKLRVVLGLMSGVVTGAAVFFKTMHLQGADILLLVGATLFSFGFLPILFYTLYVKSIQITSQAASE